MPQDERTLEERKAQSAPDTRTPAELVAFKWMLTVRQNRVSCTFSTTYTYTLTYLSHSPR